MTLNRSAEAISTNATITGLLVRLQKWLQHYRPRFARGLLPGATAAQWNELTATLETPPPEELRALLTWHNGQSPDFIGHFESDWNLMSTRQIAEATQALSASDQSSSGWQPAWVPVLDDEADDYLFLDISQPGHPLRAFWQGKTDHPVVAPSLEAWLDTFVKAVEAGKYHEDPERGSFLE